MTLLISGQFLRPTLRRYFSARRSSQQAVFISRTTRAVTMSCLVSAVVLPFIPPALESSRERNLGYPNHDK